MNSIRILSEKVAVRIAAGEVIDRPSSVVRELIDNSIDAGAHRIAVSIRSGGRSLVKVSDDGIGMSRDDLLLCIERHATSKIHDLDDLNNISTLGFRGEALASIAAVSRLTITTRRKGGLVGYRLRVAGGKVQSIEEVGAPEGTTVEVRNLFYNVPARKKFMRSARAEADNVIDAFTRIALGFEDIHFSLETDDRVALNLASTKGLVPRLSMVLGRDVAENMAQSCGAVEGIRIAAYLCSPQFARTRPDRLYVYVNKRNIRDKMINKAIIEGYGQRLMKGLYPQAVVFLDVKPSVVDVNVHPAKQEVRFRQPASLFRKIVEIVDSGLVSKVEKYTTSADIERTEQIAEPSQLSWHETVASPEAPHIISMGLEAHEKEAKEKPLLDERVRVIGQLNGTYILCEGQGGLIIVDQHAAHERVLYDKFIKSIKSTSIEVQNLLLPKTIELTLREKRLLEEKAEVLAELGIEVEDFGGQAILLRAIPSLLEEADWDVLMGEVVSILEEGKGGKGVLLDRVISLFACHGAIRAGDPLTREEMENLLEQLSSTALPTNCPHGRPVCKKITYYELEKIFKRVV